MFLRVDLIAITIATALAFVSASAWAGAGRTAAVLLTAGCYAVALGLLGLAVIFLFPSTGLTPRANVLAAIYCLASLFIGGSVLLACLWATGRQVTGWLILWVVLWHAGLLLLYLANATAGAEELGGLLAALALFGAVVVAILGVLPAIVAWFNLLALDGRSGPLIGRALLLGIPAAALAVALILLMGPDRWKTTSGYHAVASALAVGIAIALAARRLGGQLEPPP